MPRREGIYSSLISAWRPQRDQGASQALAKPAGRPPADPVERDNARPRAKVAWLEADVDPVAQGASWMPSARATCAIGRDVSITIFTASSRYAGEKLFFARAI